MKNPKKIRARIGHAGYPDSSVVYVRHSFIPGKRVAVIDVSDTEAIKQQCVAALLKIKDWPFIDANESANDAANAALESLGIITKRRAKSNG